jgi:hypothetical protein
LYYIDKIIAAFAFDACEQISKKTVRKLQTTKEGLQSGDDSKLKNIWDEICVQMKTGESLLWDFYEDLILNYIQSELGALKKETLQCIWLQTDEASDWESDIAEKMEEGEIQEYEVKVEYSETDIANYIMHEYVLVNAVNYSNKRIEKYIDNECGIS